MITRIEIDGFKTFKDFKVELAPFQVIIGPNGSGKSNLFDAFHLLSRLAEYDLLTAFQGLRGSADEQFTKYPDGRRADKMRFAVEMLVDRNVRDLWGAESILKDQRFRYEIELSTLISINGLEALRITHEELKFIPVNQDIWSKRYSFPSQTETSLSLIKTEQSIPAFYASEIPKSPKTEIYLIEEDAHIARTFIAERMDATVLSSITNTDYAHVFAVRQELSSLRFFHLNPEAMRLPSSTNAYPSLLSDGSNLPTVLARIQAEDKFALADVSLDMANLVPNLTDIELRRDEIRHEYSLWANYADAPTVSSHVMSDGTLCLLALATLANDPEFHGVLCLEEPENSVDTLYLKRIARLLKQMATDFTDPEQADEPLRQVLVTTHSPTFISLPEVIHSLLFAHTVTRVEPLSSGIPSSLVTLMTPVDTQIQQTVGSTSNIAMEGYTIDQIKKYLNDGSFEVARRQLDEVRTYLNETA